MEATLLNGRFTAREAENLLSALFKVKTDFHLAKIDTLNSSLDDIIQSEQRILELEAELGRIKTMMKDGRYEHIALHAKMTLEYCPDFHNVQL